MRILLILGLLVSLAGAAQAQGAPPPGPAPERARFGIAGGLNLATLDFQGADVEGFDELIDHRIGLVAGALVLVPVGPGIGIESGVFYSQKGAKIDLSSLDETDGTYKFDYVEVPVLLRAHMVTAGAARPYLAAGGALAVLVSAETEQGGDSEDVKDELDSTDLGLVLGGGVEISTGGTAVVLEARYTHGLLEVDDSGSDVDVSVKSRVFTLLGGVLF